MTDIDDHTLDDGLREAAEGLVRHNIRDLEALLAEIVASAARTVPGADGGGLTRTEGGTVEACHVTDEALRELDTLQVTLQEGPSQVAVDDPPPCRVVVAHDLAGPADRERWPGFAAAAVAAGYVSVISVQLSSAGRGRRSALNLYARTAGVFTEYAEAVAGLFAAQASLLLHGADQVGLMQRAIESRDVIGQAKGILMERFAVDADRAFDMLITSSQETNIKLVDVAQWLTTSGGTAAGRDALGERPLRVV